MFATRRRTLNLLLIASLGHVLLISVQVQSRSGLPLVEAVPFAAFARVEKATGIFSGGLGGVWRHYIALVGASRQNDELRQQVATLQASLDAERAVANEARALSDTLALQKSLPVQTLAARVIAGDPSFENWTVTIDRGSADGVAPDMAVVASQGVVGRVMGHPAPHAAQVQLIIGRNAAAGAVVERPDASGVIKGGAGDPPLEMEYVSNVKDVKVGDRVVTLGQDGIYPAGLLLGTVEHADRGSGLFRNLKVRPALDFGHLSVVLVIVGRDTPARPASSKSGGTR